MKRNYPGRRTAAEWNALSTAQRNMVITRIESEVLGLWARCKNKRCRRARSCIGNSFKCYWDHYSSAPRAAQRVMEKKCAWLEPFTT